MSNIRIVRFHKTKNSPYPMVYDSELNEEISGLYDLVPTLNNLSHEKEKLEDEKRKLKKCIEFYADERNWRGSSELACDDDWDTFDGASEDERRRGGKTARQVLNDLEK